MRDTEVYLVVCDGKSPIILLSPNPYYKQKIFFLHFGKIDLKLLNYINTNIITETDHSCNNIHYASYHGHHECILRLLNAGVHINKKNNDGITALHFASAKGHHECIIALLNAGADFNEKDNLGLTALHHASRDGHKECIITLLSRAKTGTNVDEGDNIGWTALIYATRWRQKECVISLLDAGADFDKKDIYGTPVFNFGSDEIKNMIKDWIEENEISIKEPC